MARFPPDPDPGGIVNRPPTPITTPVMTQASPDVSAAPPRIRGNDYSTLTPPEFGTWTPSMRVSVIAPAYNSQEKLDLTLAGLVDQSYPAELIEVIVVDNGSVPPLRLPEIGPENTRLIVCDVPGRANARNAGLRVATGDVIHWLDSDIVLERTAIEAHMRWHHLAPYLAVTSYLRFSSNPWPPPAEVIRVDERAKLFEPTQPHEWIVNLVERTDGLRANGTSAFGLHVGGSTSVNARLIEAAGPMDEALVLGEDTEMGYRLAEAGAVFVPEPASIGYHLGPTMQMRHAKAISRSNYAFIPDRIPQYRWLRAHPYRQYLVPYVEVEVEATGSSYEDVRGTVDGILASTIPDVSVLISGPWDELVPNRRAPLEDPDLDMVLVRGYYASEGRVRLGGSPVAAPYVLRVPPGWVPAETSLARLLQLMVERNLGLLSVLLDETPEGLKIARLERTAAFARAAIVVKEGEDLDAAVTDVFGSMWVDAESYDFLPAASARPPVNRRAVYQGRSDALGRAEVVRLTKEVERLKGKVTEWREESKRWRSSAVQLRREVGTLRRQVNALKRGKGIARITRRLGSLRRLRTLLTDDKRQ
jgi:glycosyltransferase involved in cell wall biosynthesis